MSDRLRRSQSCYDLNYAVLHNTGEKVYKSANMDIDRLKVKEKQVRNDLSESLRLYYLQDLNTVDDMNPESFGNPYFQLDFLNRFRMR